MKTSKNTLFNQAAALLAVSLTAVSVANAAPRTWSGGGADNNWSTAANWGGTAPVSGDSLIFAGTQRTTNLNNIASLNNMAGITFNGQNFLFGGNLITNSGGVYDTAGNNTNNLVMYLNASQGISNIVAGTRTQLGGVITNIGSGNILNLGGDGQINLNGVLNGRVSVNVNGPGVNRWAAANTFSGPVSINGGTLQLANAAAIPSGIGFGDVTNNGTLDMNGQSQTINGLFGSGIVDQLTGAASVTLSVGNTNNAGPSFYFGGNIQNTAGKINLTKIGTNVFLLGGAPSYTGSTIVNAGTLVLTNGATLASSSDFSVLPGATFNITNGPFALGSSQILTAGRTTNGGPADIIGDPNSSGTIHIYKAGFSGTLGLSGGLTLNGGLVNFDLGTSTVTGGASNDVIAINGPLSLTGTTTLRLNPIAGSFAIGNYTLITNQSTTLSGSAAGNLVVETPRGITATLNDSSFPGSLLVGISGSSTPVSLVWSGANSADWDVNLTQNWLSNGVPDKFYNLDNVVFNDNPTVATINIPTGVSPFSTVFNNSATAYILAGSGSIAGSGSLTKHGSAQVTFRNANSYLGNTVINGGTLQLDVGNASAPLTQILYNSVTPGTLVMNGGTFTKTSRANSTSYQLFGATIFNPGPSVIFQPGRTSSSTPAIYLGPITRNAGGTADIQPQTGTGGTQAGATTGIFTTTANNNASAAGILGGYATWNAAFGTAEFARVNANAGAQGGTHIYGGATYANFFAANTNTDMTADITAANNTNTMSVRFATASARTLTLTGTNIITSGGILVGNGVGANQSTITGGTALTSGNGQDLIFHQYDLTGNLVVNSVVSDNYGSSIALTKAGGGTVILGAANSYTGPTYINAGTLQIGNNGTVGSIDNSPGVTNRGTLSFKRTDAVTFAAPIAGLGAISQLGAGSVTLTGNNSYLGLTTISAGTLQVGNGGTSGSLGNSSGIVDNGSLIFNRSDSLSFSGPISGSGNLTKQGAGALTLGGTNSYAGATLLSNGKIILGASAVISNTAAFVLAGGTTLNVASQGNLTLFGGTVNQILAGTGTVEGSITTSSGTGAGTRITPGTNGVVGTLTITNALTLNGGTVNFDVATNSKDYISVGGDLTLAAGTIALNAGTLTNGVYKLIGYTGALGGSVGNLVVSGFSQSGKVASLSSAVAGEIDLVISPYVPVNLVWQGDGAGNPWDVLTTADWTNSAGAATQFNQNDNAKFDDTSVNTTVNLATVLTPNTITVNGSANSYTLQGAGSIAGGSLTNNNPNTLTILTANSYSGQTTINAGTLALGNGSTAGTLGAGPVQNNAAVVFNEPSDTIVGNAFSGSGQLIHSAANVLSLAANSTMSGPVTISGGTLQVGVGSSAGSLGTSTVTNNGKLQITRSGTLTVGGNITGSGTVIVDGSGTVTLSGANDYQNNTYISNGVVKLGSSSAIPSGGATTGWLILDGGAAAAGKLDLNGFDQTINALAGLSGTVLGQINNDGGSGTNTLTINQTAATTFSGNIVDKSGVTGGKVALVKNGSTTLTLNPGGTGSTFSGGTTINDGVISGGSSTTANATMLGSGPVIFGTNGILELAGFSGGSVGNDYGGIQNPVVVTSNNTAIVRGSTRAGTGFAPSSVTGPTNSSLIYVNRYVRGNVGGNWNNFFGVLLATNISTTPNNAGDFRLNTGTGFPNTRMILAPSQYMYNVLAGTPTIPIGELTGDTTATIAVNTASGGSAARFVIGGLNTSAQYDGSIIEGHGFVKVGTGKWTLTSATLSYSGLTTVSNGVLALGAAANLTASTPITIAAPGILDVSASGTLTLAAQTIQGNGTVLGSLVTGAGTTVSPGGASGIGALTITNDVNLAGTTVMELNRTNAPATNDTLIAATITAGGTLQVNNLGSDLHTGDTFKLFSVPVTGAFAVTNLPVTTGDGLITYVWTNKLAIDGTIKVLVGVPNVSTTPTNITTSVSGSTLTLSWPASHTGWRLQVQTNLLGGGINPSGTWYDVAGSASVNTVNITLDPANGTVFYRMVYP
jgi:autotransporter-associated beta strand protein